MGEVQLPRVHYTSGGNLISGADTKFVLTAQNGTSNIKRWHYYKIKGIKIPYLPHLSFIRLLWEFRGGIMMQRWGIRSPAVCLCLLVRLFMPSFTPPLRQDPIQAVSLPPVQRESPLKAIPLHGALALSINYEASKQVRGNPNNRVSHKWWRLWCGSVVQFIAPCSGTKTGLTSSNSPLCRKQVHTCTHTDKHSDRNTCICRVPGNNFFFLCFLFNL